MGCFNNQGVMIWDFGFVNGLDDYEVNQVLILKHLLRNIVLVLDKEDAILCVHSGDNVYSVAEGVRIMLGSNLALDFDWVKVVWNKLVPSKMAIFQWLSIRGGVSVKEVLKYRHCLREGIDDKCQGLKACSALLKWWNVSWVMPYDIPSFSIQCYNGLGIKAKKAWRLIGLATYWFIWLARNDLIFNDVSKGWMVVVESIKLKVFPWLVNAHKAESHQFYVWQSQPWEMDSCGLGGL
ncbi:uncharacterized protein [Rutidosis leptorrhynchoides]|uniref:uncharacterized protein n=1 Tax=Rutidosis leptorrhynchoides TaxID=125765 RepID=UPI003A992840